MDELTAVLRARALVKKINPSTCRAPIEAYLAEVGAVLRRQHDMGPDEAGWCFEKDGKRFICVNGKDSEERIRFTACHEVAHIVLELPSEHGNGPAWSYAKKSPNEILCDVFASELLLSYNLFKPLVDRAEISLSTVDDLAQKFEASTMATGSRFASLASAPCAFVLSEQGKVRYASRSTPLREAKAWVEPRIALPQGSVCARARAGKRFSGPEEIDADVWFKDWERGGALLEDARHLQKWDQTIALLWFEDEEVPAMPRDRHVREEEEQGLAELDGILPWPEKKRRK